MKKFLSVILTVLMLVSSVIILSACGGAAQEPKEPAAEQATAETEEPAAAEAAEPATEEPTAEDPATAEEPPAEQPTPEPGIELLGLSKYSRMELGMLMEYDVSNHQVNENGQITQFDLHRTNLEKVQEEAALLEDVDTEDSTILLEYDENGDIVSARTDIPGYGFTLYELTYNDGLIDTNTFSTDWSTVERPYKLQFTYEENDGTLTGIEGECIDGQKVFYPCEYEYDENGNVSRITRTVSAAFIVYVDIEYDENHYVTKITSTNPGGAFLVCEFEYTSLGEVGRADTVKTGFRKWQEFSIIEEALKNCY